MKTINIRAPIGPSGIGLVDLDAELERHPGAALDVCSDGGCSRSAEAMAKRIQAARLNVYAHKAASAAVMLVIAGHRRILAENGWLAVHPCWMAIAGGGAEFEAAARNCASVDDLKTSALARYSKLTTAEAAEAIAGGKVWRPDEAMAAGLVDEIGPPSELVGTAPERLEDGPIREFEALRDRAERARRLGEFKREKAEAAAANELGSAITAAGRDEWEMYGTEFMAPPDRIAAIFDGAAGDAMRRHRHPDKEPAPARWPCVRCGALNHSPPASRNGPARCFTCNINPEETT